MHIAWRESRFGPDQGCLMAPKIVPRMQLHWSRHSPNTIALWGQMAAVVRALEGTSSRVALTITLVSAFKGRGGTSKTRPSGSWVTNSGPRSEKAFWKGAGHQRKLCFVELPVQERPLCCVQSWQRASPVRNGVHRDKIALAMWFITMHKIV